MKHPVQQRRAMVISDHPALSIKVQCRLLQIQRSGWYYEPVPESADNLRIMRLLDGQLSRHAQQPALPQDFSVAFAHGCRVVLNRQKSPDFRALAISPSTANHLLSFFDCQLEERALNFYYCRANLVNARIGNLISK